MFFSSLGSHDQTSCETSCKQGNSGQLTLSILSIFPLFVVSTSLSVRLTTKNFFFYPPTHSTMLLPVRNRGGPLGVSHWLPHRPFALESWWPFCLSGCLLFFPPSLCLTSVVGSYVITMYYALNLPVLFYLYCHTMDVAHEISIASRRSHKAQSFKKW